jgi:DNA (cytosine-5)-methyltransferase 1
MLNGLDLFSGIGALTLALATRVRPVAYCESDRYAQSVLLSRMRDGSLPSAPIWDDVRTLRGYELSKTIDIIYGGFPCQDISVAGDGGGLEGSRSGLFFEVVRLARDLRPRFLFLENVPALTVRGLDRVLLELVALGFDCRWTIVSAAEVGAPHLRERIWIAAHANGNGVREQPERDTGRSDALQRGRETESLDPGSRHTDAAGIGRLEVGDSDEGRNANSSRDGSPFADTCRAGRQRWLDAGAAWEAFALGGGGGCWPSWLPEPAICRGSDGTAHRVDALRGLGNAVVPQAADKAHQWLGGLI